MVMADVGMVKGGVGRGASFCILGLLGLPFCIILACLLCFLGCCGKIKNFILPGYTVCCMLYVVCSMGFESEDCVLSHLTKEEWGQRTPWGCEGDGFRVNA